MQSLRCEVLSGLEERTDTQVEEVPTVLRLLCDRPPPALCSQTDGAQRLRRNGPPPQLQTHIGTPKMNVGIHFKLENKI